MTTFTAGQKLTAAALNSGFEIRYIQKANPATYTNITTFASDPEIVLTNLAIGIWEIDWVASVTGPSTADVKFQWVLGGGAAQQTPRACVGPSTGAATVIGDAMCRSSMHNWTSPVSYGTDGTNASAIREVGLIVVSGSVGSLTLQGAQQTLNATPTVLGTNTYIRARKIT